MLGTARINIDVRSSTAMRRPGKRTDKRAIGSAAIVDTSPAPAAYPAVVRVAPQIEALGTVDDPPAMIK